MPPQLTALSNVSELFDWNSIVNIMEEAFETYYTNHPSGEKGVLPPRHITRQVLSSNPM